MDELAAHLGAVSLRSPTGSGSGLEMEIDSDADTHSVDSLNIVAEDPPEPGREERLQAIARRVAAVESAQQTLMARIEAQVQQISAKRHDQLLQTTPFAWLLDVVDGNRATRFEPLQRAAIGFLDVSREWRQVADRHAVALGAAQRFGLADVQATAGRAIEECEAAASRAEMRGLMLQALGLQREGLQDAGRGHFRPLEMAADALREVTGRAHERGLAWLPGDGFDLELQRIAEAAHAHLVRAAGVVNPQDPFVWRVFQTEQRLPLWHVRSALAALDLMDAAESLRASQTHRPRDEQALGNAVAQTRHLFERLAASLQAELHAAEAATGGPDLYPLEYAAGHLAQRAGELHASVSDADALRRLGLPLAAPSVLAQPFAVLHQACSAVEHAAKQFGPGAAAALKQAATAAQEAAAMPGGLMPDQMAALGTFCNRLAQDVLAAHAGIRHEAARDFLWQSRQASLSAGQRLEVLMNGLQGLLAGAALPSAPAGDLTLAEQMRTVAREAQAQLAAPALPADAPPRALITERTTQLTLQCTAVAATAIAESLAVCHQALQELPQTTPQRRAAVAQGLAERVRSAGAAVVHALAEQIALSDAALPEHLMRVVQEQGTKLRHVERLAERIRLPLQALGLMLKAQQGAQDFREAARALPPAQVLARIGEVGLQSAQAEELLKTGAQQLVARIQAEKASAEGGSAAMLSLEAIAVIQSFKGLRLRATVERDLAQGRVLVDLLQRSVAERERSGRPGRADLLPLMDQVKQHLQRSADEIAQALSQPARSEAVRPLQEVADGLQRELQACRAQLASIALSAQAGAPATGEPRRR